MEETTTIRVSKTTKDMLDELGNKGESYDQIINKIMKKKEVDKNVQQKGKISNMG